ncbi:MAG: YihY/virulence factor BrkB family protein [Alphaproteobacteria bacterium]
MKRYFKSLWTAIYQISLDISFELSGYIAYTTLLSLFPFLIVLVATAGMAGQRQVAQDFIVESYEMLPDEVVGTVDPIISNIINNPQHTLLTVAIIGIFWLTSSGVEALRTGLNYAFKIKETRSFLFRRAQAIGFVMLAAISFLVATVALVVAPLVLQWTLDHTPIAFNIKLAINIARYMLALSALVITITAVYRWLPNHTFNTRECLPGALTATALWIGLANLYSIYLKHFGQYDVIYGSLGGIILTLIFLHISSVIVLYGARVNAALLD